MSDEDESRLGAYAPPAEDHGTFDAREVESERRGPVLLLASLVVFLLFVAVVWSAYRQGVRDREDPPVVAAEEAPYRRAPDDPGGYEAPGQDIEAYSLREPEPSEDARTGVDDGAQAETSAQDTAGDAGARELPPVRVETGDEPSGAAADAEEAAPSQPAPESEPAPTEPASASADAAPAAETSSGAASASGPWVVQIAAFRSREDAESGWVTFATRFPDLARGRAPDVQRADLGERGIYHRLRVAGFESREAAAAYCADLSDQGQSCLVARR